MTGKQQSAIKEIAGYCQELDVIVSTRRPALFLDDANELLCNPIVRRYLVDLHVCDLYLDMYDAIKRDTFPQITLCHRNRMFACTS